MARASRPFRFNPKLAARFARLHRIKRKHSPATDKASLRQAAIDAAASHAITIIPTNHRARAKPFDVMD